MEANQENRENLLEKISDVESELEDEKKLLRENQDFFDLLSIPEVDLTERMRWLRNVFDGKVSDETLALLCILAEKSDVIDFSTDLEKFRTLLNQTEHVSRGIIYSVKPLDEEKIRYFRMQTETLLKKKVSLVNHIDKSLLGGVCISVDGKMIDMSLRKKLEDMHVSIEDELLGMTE